MLSLSFSTSLLSRRHVLPFVQLSSKLSTRLFTATTSLSSTAEAEAAKPWQPDFSQYHAAFPSVTASQWAQLDALAVKLYDWNSKVNLVSRQDIVNLVPNHILPCMAIAKVRSFQAGERVIDVGTGGGLPGLPLSILHPQTHFTLLDSNSKKMMVVRDIVSSMGLSNVNVVCLRAEEHTERYDFILGRAVTNLPNFLSFSSHFLTYSDGYAAPSSSSSSTELLPSGLLYLKGGEFSDEIEAAGINTNNTSTSTASVGLFPITTLVPGLISDKNVLYVQRREVVAFHGRHAKAAALTATAASKAGKGGKGGGGKARAGSARAGPGMRTRPSGGAGRSGESSKAPRWVRSKNPGPGERGGAPVARERRWGGDREGQAKAPSRG